MTTFGSECDATDWKSLTSCYTCAFHSEKYGHYFVQVLIAKITIFESRSAVNARIKYCYKYMVSRITLKLIWFK